MIGVRSGPVVEWVLGAIVSGAWLLLIFLDTPEVTVSRGLCLAGWLVGLVCLYFMPPERDQFRKGYLSGLVLAVAIAVIAWLL